MNLEELTNKYISMAEQVLNNYERNPMPISLTQEKLTTALRWAMDYLRDAKYYKSQGKLETSLTSIAYCEGILDALRLMGAVKFEWPTNRPKEK
jgi:FAD synthetase